MNTADFNIKEKNQDSDKFMPVFIPPLSIGLNYILCRKKKLLLFLSFLIQWFWWKNTTLLSWKRLFHRSKSYFPYSKKLFTFIPLHPKKGNNLLQWVAKNMRVLSHPMKSKSFPSVWQHFYGNLIQKWWYSHNYKLWAIITSRDWKTLIPLWNGEDWQALLWYILQPYRCPRRTAWM